MKKLSCIALLLFLIYSCSGTSGKKWQELVSTETSFIIVPKKDASMQSMLQSKYTPFLDDVTSSAIQLMNTVDSSASQSLSLQSIFLYPGANQKLQPIWVTNTDDELKEHLKNKYARPFSQNEYHFHGTSVLDLKVENRHLYIAEISNMLLISESSLGIEKSIRAYRGMDPVADLSGLDIKPGSLIINTPSLDQWLQQLGRVIYGPSIAKAFAGTRPAVLNLTENGEGEESQLQLSGEIRLSDDVKSPLVRAVSNEARPITLDEYISSRAAAFGIFHAPPAKLTNKAIPDTTAVDAFFLNNETEYNDLAGMLDSEFGLVTYNKSGFLSTGEHLFLRKVKNTDRLRSKLEELTTRNLIENVEDAYFAQSYLLNELIGSSLSNFKDFYIKIIGDAVVISKRKGLAEMIASDRSRRRVITYEQFYKKIKDTLPENTSGLFIAGPDFNSFLTPFLAPDNYVDALTSPFDYIALTTRRDAENDAFSFNIATFKDEAGNNPYRENWIYSTGGAELSGHPVFGNVAGTYNDEVVFATKTGTVYVVAGDGTLVQQFNTGRDVPVGSPVVYDWYGTGENVVLIAAGNKIYGWDDNGDLLPKFPFELSEQVTTPLTIADINNNKLPDAIVATADRKLHVLNGRGNNLSGWPVTTNARVRAVPLIGYLENKEAVIAFSSNAVHAWDAGGNTLQNFPVFVNAALTGSPVIFKGHIYGNAVDGNLYSIGKNASFSDSLTVSGSSSDNVKAVYIASGALSGSPSVNELAIPNSGNSQKRDLLLTTSANGSVFLLNPSGQLRLTKSMGQPTAESSSAFITDINSDGSSDIVALASYGRLYAWNIETGERIFDLPTTAISHFSIVDLDGDGLKELIGQTENGVQSWTINR